LACIKNDIHDKVKTRKLRDVWSCYSVRNILVPYLLC
jgi:hypothetical protein